MAARSLADALSCAAAAVRFGNRVISWLDTERPLDDEAMEALGERLAELDAVRDGNAPRAGMADEALDELIAA